MIQQTVLNLFFLSYTCVRMTTRVHAVAAGWLAWVLASVWAWPRMSAGNDWLQLACLVALNLLLTVTIAYADVPLKSACVYTHPKIQIPRGTKYSMDLRRDDYDDKCFLTSWAIGHILMYAVISFAVPTRWLELYLIGVAFEIWEAFHGAEYVMDLVWNGLGICIGLGVRHLISSAA